MVLLMCIRCCPRRGLCVAAASANTVGSCVGHWRVVGGTAAAAAATLPHCHTHTHTHTHRPRTMRPHRAATVARALPHRPRPRCCRPTLAALALPRPSLQRSQPRCATHLPTTPFRPRLSGRFDTIRSDFPAPAAEVQRLERGGASSLRQRRNPTWAGSQPPLPHQRVQRLMLRRGGWAGGQRWQPGRSDG